MNQTDGKTVKYPMSDGQTKHAPPLALYRAAGNLVFFAGQGAVNGQGEFIGSDIETQFRHTMGLVRDVLAEAGCTFADVVHVRSYVQNAADIPRYNELYREYFSEPYPARTTVVNCLPEGLLYEIDVIAERRGGEGGGGA